MNEEPRLFLVATPIGNLEDISLRALRILKEVDWIAAEDTRHTGLLLKHFEIKKPMISYREHNQNQAGSQIMTLLSEGQKVALVSDAGMPGISDPGVHLVRLAMDNQVPYTIIPGASAGISALVLSGLNTERFAFEGFLPIKNNIRLKRLKEIAQDKRTLILYEAPHRIMKTLLDLKAHIQQNRQVVLVREMTKIHEEVVRGNVDELIEWANHRTVKGEIVLLLEGAQQEVLSLPNDIVLRDELMALLSKGVSKKNAVEQLSQSYPINRQELYRILLQEETSDGDNYGTITKNPT